MQIILASIIFNNLKKRFFDVLIQFLHTRLLLTNRQYLLTCNHLFIESFVLSLLIIHTGFIYRYQSFKTVIFIPIDNDIIKQIKPYQANILAVLWLLYHNLFINIDKNPFQTVIPKRYNGYTMTHRELSNNTIKRLGFKHNSSVIDD